MRPVILICIAAYAAAMEAVNLAAHQIVGHFGVIGGLVTIAAMYGAAVYSERRRL
ncbi:hypothetical protein ACQR1H_03230 [Bradyrhizobium sp. HKCCYLRH2015]|uniref:hypothetical protein n=1 Tax=Bradyrhizobium sp. HKCCYLRH2015 TaxID=3420742 RepID=UPI003EB936D2